MRAFRRSNVPRPREDTACTLAFKSARRLFPVKCGWYLRDIPIFTGEARRCFKDSDLRTKVGEH